MEDRLVARWETKGKDWLELLVTPSGYYHYRGNGCGGGPDRTVTNDAAAVAYMTAPWGAVGGTGQVTVLQSDRPSLKRVF